MLADAGRRRRRGRRRPARRSPPGRARPRSSGPAALTRLAALLDERADDLARTETRQTGKPIRLSTGFDVPGTVDNVAFFAGAARNLEGKAAGEYSGDHTSYVRREAIGVVGSVAPWNYPLQMAAWKILPADRRRQHHRAQAGRADAAHRADVRRGGHRGGHARTAWSTSSPAPGRVAGEALMSHPDVDMVSFTGSSAVGRRVMELAAARARSGSTSSSAARRRSSSSTTPTSRPPCRARSPAR